MRKTTLASLLILCGSTAALAQTMTPPEPGMQNNMANMTMGNDATTMDNAADPAAPNSSMANETNPPPR